MIKHLVIKLSIGVPTLTRAFENDNFKDPPHVILAESLIGLLFCFKILLCVSLCLTIVVHPLNAHKIPRKKS